MSETNEHEIIEILYTNSRGDMKKRRIHPRRIFFGETNWHPHKQWVLEAFDVDQGSERVFALKDIQAWLPHELQLAPF